MSIINRILTDDTEPSSKQNLYANLFLNFLK